MNPTLRRTALLLAALPVTFAAACSSGESPPESAVPLPQEIQGMRRVGVTEGEEAKAMIGELHAKDLAPLASYVGHYGDGPTHAMLYTSRFRDAATANETLDDMSSEIGEGSSGFSHHMTMDVAGTPVHLVLGQGQVHFFFTDDSRLSWLAIDAPMARGGLAQVLGVEPTEVPSIVRVGAVDAQQLSPARTRPEGPSSGTAPSPGA